MQILYCRLLYICKLTNLQLSSSQAMYQRMQAMIAQCEYTIEKGMNTYEMNKQEKENYEKLSDDIGESFIRILSFFFLHMCFFFFS